MPGTTTVRGAAVQRALVAGKLTMKDVEVCARRVLQLVKKAQLSSIPFDAAQDGVDTPELRDVSTQLPIQPPNACVMTTFAAPSKIGR